MKRRGPGFDPGLFSFLPTLVALLAAATIPASVSGVGFNGDRECPLFWADRATVAPVPHPTGPRGDGAIADARRWLELGRPSETLRLLAAAQETPQSRLYRLGALAALRRWSEYDRLRTDAPDVADVDGCEAIVARWDAYAAAAGGKPADAAAALDRLVARAPALDPYVALWRLEAAAEGGDLSAGRTAWSEAAASSLPDIAKRDGRAAMARLYARAGALDEAQEAYRGLALESRGAERAEHWLTAAELADRAGDRAAADRYRRRVLETLPAHAVSIVLDEGLRNRAGLTPIETARTFLAAGRFRLAAEAATTVLETSRAPEADREALEIRARARGATGDRAGAEADYAAILARWPNDGRTVDVLYARARLALGSGDGDTARTRLANLIARFPSHERVAGARYLIADSYQDDRGRDPTFADRAIEGFDTVARAHARSFYADRAYMRAAHLTLAIGRHRDAADRYRAYAGSQSAREARYWLARALEAGGETAAAREVLSRLATTGGGDYYALMARSRLGGRSWLDTIGIGSGQVPVFGRVEAPPEHPAWETAVALLALGERQYAEAELARALSSVGRDREVLAHWGRALVAWGFPNLAIRAGVSLGERGAGERFAFPAGYAAAVSHEAERHGIDPFMMLALIRQESLFDPDVVSPAGAVGVMQILPATGAEMANDTGWDGYDRSVLFDPAASLHLGARYLEIQARRFDGFWPAVLAAYNGGPHNVERWSTFDERAADPEMWIDRIPFRETRDYVKRVLANYALYERLSRIDAAGR